MVTQKVSVDRQNMLTASELASLLNVHINTVRRWSDTGLLRSYRIGRRGDRRFSMDDIDLFLSTSLHAIGTRAGQPLDRYLGGAHPARQ